MKSHLGTPANFYRPDGYCVDESVSYLMKRIIMAVTQAADRRLEPDGLTHIQWGPLFMISASRASTVAELARELSTDAGAMTRLLDRLESKGLCRRERCRDDRRVVRIGLTPEGEKAAARVPVVIAQLMNEVLTGFSRDEWMVLKDMLKRMLANAETRLGREAPEPAEPAAAPAGKARAPREAARTPRVAARAPRARRGAAAERRAAR